MTDDIPILPAWRYHATQGAKLFVTAEEIAAAEAQGWADSPAAALEAVDIDNARDATAVVSHETPIHEPQDDVAAAKKRKRKTP